MIASAERVHRFASEDLDRMVAAGVLRPDDRVELILGVLYDLSPRRSRHTAAVHKMLDALRAAYSDVGAHVRVQSPLRLAGDSQPEPDLAVVSGAIDDSIDSHPTSAVLVVEVADSSLRLDRVQKASMYATSGVPDYWILNLVDDCLETYTTPVVGATCAAHRLRPRGCGRRPWLGRFRPRVPRGGRSPASTARVSGVGHGAVPSPRVLRFARRLR